MINRRHFLGTMGLAVPTLFVSASLHPLRARDVLDDIKDYPGTPEDIASDEDFWFNVQQAFTVDRSLVNLNNGGVSPAPAIVQEAMKRHLDFSNEAPVYNMWRILEPEREGVRKRLARFFACDPEEVALTRNASEGLEICQLGFDLERGDEVLTTNQDYPRMINTWKQLEKRAGVALKMFSIPTPAEDVGEIVSLFEQNITSRTRLILVSHMIFLTGQIMPVREIVKLGRSKGIPVIVDGAHAFAHFDFTNHDLDCDYYGTSLHKWLFAPHGTGLLYVRKEKIPSLWPMMAAPEEKKDDIRKFEEIGTHPAANYLAISEALTFTQGIGMKRKEARLRFLRNRWANHLLQYDRVKLHTSLKPGFSCAIANVEIDGLDPGKITSYLWSKHRIIVTTIKHKEFQGVRVSPSVYTTLEEIDRFTEAMEHIIKKGLPE